MRKKLFILILVIVLISVMSLSVIGTKENMYTARGQILREFLSSKDTTLAAECGDTKIYVSAVENERKTAQLSPLSEGKLTDREITEKLVKDALLLLESKKLGFTAAQKEIDDFVAYSKASYDVPEGKQLLDDLCAGAGISIDEYYAMVEEKAPIAILRQKVKDYYGKEYCEANGLTFTKVNPPAEMEEYIEERMDGLMEKYADIITIYIE